MKRKLSIYRPNNKGDGAAAQFEFTDGKDAVWLSMAPQNGEKSFNWKEGKINVKLGIYELGAILAVCEGRVGGLGQPDGKGGYKGSIHQIQGQDQNSTIIGLTPAAGKEDQPARYLSISAKRNGEVLPRLSVGLGTGEREVLAVFCRHAMLEMMVDDYQGGGGEEASSTATDKPVVKPTTASAPAKKPAGRKVEAGPQVNEDGSDIPF